MWHTKYHSGYSICHIWHNIFHLNLKAETSALHSKYNYTNNGDIASITNNGVLKIFLGYINTKKHMVLIIY